MPELPPFRAAAATEPQSAGSAAPSLSPRCAPQARPGTIPGPAARRRPPRPHLPGHGPIRGPRSRLRTPNGTPPARGPSSSSTPRPARSLRAAHLHEGAVAGEHGQDHDRARGGRAAATRRADPRQLRRRRPRGHEDRDAGPAPAGRSTTRWRRLMMVSANDAAYAIAESAGGSISGFANDANETARRYGMRDSTFGDPAGLTDQTSYKGGPKVSAFDLAIATRNALTVPAIRALGRYDRLRVHRSVGPPPHAAQPRQVSCRTTASATSARKRCSRLDTPSSRNTHSSRRPSAGGT